MKFEDVVEIIDKLKAGEAPEGMTAADALAIRQLAKAMDYRYGDRAAEAIMKHVDGPLGKQEIAEQSVKVHITYVGVPELGI